MLERTIAFLGAGNMAEALIKGLLRAGTAAPEPSSPPAAAPSASSELQRDLRRAHHLGQPGRRPRGGHRGALREAAGHGQAASSRSLPRWTTRKLVISVAAGVPIAALERRLGAGARIIRTMPNTPSLVGAGACALARGEHATEEDLAVATRIFQAVGITTVVDENLLDAVTGLSGSGPAYIFLVIEALSDAGVKVGLPRYTALSSPRRRCSAAPSCSSRRTPTPASSRTR